MKESVERLGFSLLDDETNRLLEWKLALSLKRQAINSDHAMNSWHS